MATRSIHLQAGLNRVVYTDTEIEGQDYTGTVIDPNEEIYYQGDPIGTLFQLKNRPGADGTDKIFLENGTIIGDVDTLEHALTVRHPEEIVEIGKCYKYKDGEQGGQYIGELESYTLETEEGHAARQGVVEAAAAEDATRTRGILRRTDSEETDAQCPICYEIMNDPATLLCGHSACLNCIRLLIASPTANVCMTCRHPISRFCVQNDLRVNIFMRNYINRRYPDEMRRRDYVRKTETREFVFVFNDGGERREINGEAITTSHLKIEETPCPKERYMMDDVGSNRKMHKGGKRKSRRTQKKRRKSKRRTKK
jgi:hypothetical protein